MRSGLLDQIKKPEPDIPSVDPAAKQLVWIRAASRTVNPGKNQEKNRKNLDKATQKLLKDFPPTRK